MAVIRFCQICKRQINPERAEALAGTRLCIEHAIQIEEFGGEFRLSWVQETTSKKGSLKKNYGGVTVRFRRNWRALEELQRAHERALGF